MFVEREFNDIIQLLPRDIRTTQRAAILQALDDYYASQYVRGVGVYVTATEVLRINDKSVHQRDPSVHYNIDFRAIVFSPRRGQLVEGHIHSQDHRGIHLVLQFFNDVFVPAECLFRDCAFSEEEQTWVWQFGEHSYFFDKGEQVRFKVLDCQFNNSASNGDADAGDCYIDQMLDNQPYVVIGAMNECGLGCIRWWR